MKDDVCFMLVVGEFDSMHESLRRFISWCELDFVRFSVELVGHLNVIVLTEILRQSRQRVRLIEGRGVDLSVVVSMLGRNNEVKKEVSGKNVEGEVSSVFPKITSADLGVGRSPTYIIGEAYDVCYVNAMIEFCI